MREEIYMAIDTGFRYGDKDLKVKIIKNHHINTMVDFGARAFEEIGGEAVKSVAFVLEKND